MTRIMLGSCPIDLRDERAVLLETERRLRDRSTAPLAVASGNLDHLHHFGPRHRSPSLLPVERDQLHWLTLLDGAPLVYRARRASGTKYPRLAGSDLLMPILELAESLGSSVGFIGGTAEMHTALRARLLERVPMLNIVGMWAPMRSELADHSANCQLSLNVRETKVDLLVIGLGKPRQELWIDKYGEATGARVLLAFGASADFVAGHVERAPQWTRDHGLEWAYRLVREPRRLARRYLVQGPAALSQLLLTPVARAALPATASRDRLRHVAVVTVTYNSRASIEDFLASVRSQCSSELTVSIVVIDNGSTDGCAEYLRSAPGLTLLEGHENLGFAAGVNMGRRHVPDDADAIAFLNPDVTLSPGCLRSLADALTDPDIGVTVPRILDENGNLARTLRRDTTVLSALGDALFGEHARRRPAWLSDILLLEKDYASGREVDWASGAAWMMARDCDAVVGDWLEEYFLYSEEAHTARRVRRAGFQLLYVPLAQLTHVGGMSGRSAELDALRSVNRERDFASNHSRPSSLAFRAVNVLQHLLRAYDAKERRVLRIVMSPGRRGALFGRTSRGRSVVR